MVVQYQFIFYILWFSNYPCTLCFVLWSSLPANNRRMDGHTEYIVHNSLWPSNYESFSNMNASSFITFFTYMLRQDVIPFWKELFVAVKMTSNIKKHSLYFSCYRPLYKGHSCLLKYFWSKLPYTFWYMCDYIVSYLCKFVTKWHQLLDASLSNNPTVACRKEFILSCFNLE